MPCLVIELCRRCDGRFLARIVRYGRVIGEHRGGWHWNVIYISKDYPKEDEAIEECRAKAEKKRWGETRIADGVEDLPENINMLKSHYGPNYSPGPIHKKVYRDPGMHKTIQKVK